MTKDERRAQMIIALKLMREVVDDVVNEAHDNGEDTPGDYTVWRRAGMDSLDSWVTRVVWFVRGQTYTSRESWDLARAREDE